MLVYLLRHGIAEDQKPGNGDAARELTAEGRTELKRILKAVVKAGVKPSLILASPYTRARDTAKLARKILKTEEDLLETKTLAPEGQPQSVWSEICDHRKEESLMLVSHNPLMEQLVSFLLGTPTLQFDFKKGAIVAIEIDNFRGQPNGVLLWAITPELT